MPYGQVAGHCVKIVAEKGCVGARRADGRSLYEECSGKGCVGARMADGRSLK